MKSRIRLAAALVFVSGLMFVPMAAPPAYAATLVKSAPYSSDSTQEACITYFDAYCIQTAGASRTDGSISVEASVNAPAMTTGQGMARSDGKITGAFKPAASARNIQTLTHIRIDSGSAEVIGALSQGFAHLVAEVTMNVACATCPSGSITTSTLITLADTDSATPAPAFVGDTTLTVPLSVQFGGGQKAGTGAVNVRVYARGELGTHFREPVEEIARARGLVTVSKIEVHY